VLQQMIEERFGEAMRVQVPHRTPKASALRRASTNAGLGTRIAILPNGRATPHVPTRQTRSSDHEACYLTCSISRSGVHRAYSWAPRWLAHINRLPLTVKRTLDVQLSRGVEQSATILRPASICCFLLNIQNVSPAHAPSALMTVSCT